MATWPLLGSYPSRQWNLSTEQRKKAASPTLIPVPGPFRQADPASVEISYITKHMGKKALDERESLGRWNWAETPLGIPRGNKICSLERGGAEGRAVWRRARPDLSDHTDVFTGADESGRWLFETQDFCWVRESNAQGFPICGLSREREFQGPSSETSLAAPEGTESSCQADERQRSPDSAWLQGEAAGFAAMQSGNCAWSPSGGAVRGMLSTCCPLKPAAHPPLAQHCKAPPADPPRDAELQEQIHWRPRGSLGRVRAQLVFGIVRCPNSGVAFAGTCRP